MFDSRPFEYIDDQLYKVPMEDGVK